MKKSWAMFGLVLILIISLSVFVSAGFFSNFWEKITGKAISPLPEDCTPYTCSNLGYDCGGPYNDGCGGTISSCGNCVSGKICQNGVCVTSSAACIDSDGPFNIINKGNCTNSTGTYWDSCLDSSRVYERSCLDTECIKTWWDCSLGYICSNGACVSATAPGTTPPTYSLNQTNNTIAGQATKFSLYVNDNALSPKGAYIFSTNNTGGWVNDSPVFFTTTPSWGNVTKILNSADDLTIGYRWYLNDSAGNINFTPVYGLVTTATCETCTEHSGFTWCNDLGKCVDDPAGAGCANSAGNRIQFVSDCSSNLQECKPSLGEFASYANNPSIGKVLGGIIYHEELSGGCAIDFSFSKLAELPAGYEFNVQNKRIISILNISSADSSLEASLNFSLNETEIHYPFSMSFYIWSGTKWELLSYDPWKSPVINEDAQGKRTYNYIISTPHFSLFLIVEPDFCGNGKFDAGWEQCDESLAETTDCTSCICNSGTDPDGKGSCVKEKVNETCSEAGKEDCVGYTLYTCNSSLMWEKNGTIVGNCGVNCSPIGNLSCDGEISLKCGADYKWASQGKVNGLCGYVSDIALDYPSSEDKCGNGVCNYDEDEYSCPEDCVVKEQKEEKSWFVIFLIVFVAILILVLIVVLSKVFSKRKSSFHEPSVPPLYGPGGPRLYPGTHPPAVHHRVIRHHPPAVHHAATSQPIHSGSAERYPVKHYPR